MYQRYEIETREAPPAAFVPNKFKPAVHRRGLAKMLIKEALHYRFNKDILLSRPCIYGVFSGPVGGFWPLKQKCVGCMRCVLEYPEFCEVFIDDKYKQLGDSYFDADSVGMLNFEATTGKIQVKGVGYKGPFTGPGFDSMWTDMSEIVRPTRDGIYGREYISTAVDIGRKPKSLNPSLGASRGKQDEGMAIGSRENEPIVEIQLPILFDELPPVISHPSVGQAVWAASRRLGTMFISRSRPPEKFFSQWVPLITDARTDCLANLPKNIRMLEYEFPRPPLSSNGGEGKGEENYRILQTAFPEAVIAARLALNERSADQVIELYRHGWGVFHLTADYHGREMAASRREMTATHRSKVSGSRFIKDSLLELHRRLVQDGIRDEITLIVSGGIIRAEHLPKVIICGADLVALNTPVLVALHAEFRGDCTDGSGGMKTREVALRWGEQRIVNLCASWRNQMLEIVSAMGIRDIRRLRGETGRAMFFEDLEKEWLKA